MSMKELNEKLSIISRVVVHPKYRTIGLGSKLVRETLHLAGTPYVEMPAVMAKYNPFAEKGGMKKIAEQPTAKRSLSNSRNSAAARL
jgi:ABC-type ATPase with predicted acetyltransferase domain